MLRASVRSASTRHGMASVGTARHHALAMSMHLATFGVAVAGRFATGGGELEDLLRGPLENLLGALAGELGFDMQLAGEHHLADERVRPDYAVYVSGVLVGFLEVKAPGKGVDPARFRGHDRQQWQRLSCLPNVMYTDGQSFALFRDGERQTRSRRSSSGC